MKATIHTNPFQSKVMKRNKLHINLISSCILSLCFAFAPVNISAQTNAQIGYETGTIGSWIFSTTPDGDSYVAINNNATYVRTGSYSFRVQEGSTTTRYGYNTGFTVQTTATQQVVHSIAWIKTGSAGSFTANPGLARSGASSNGTLTSVNNTSWKRVTHNWSTGAAGYNVYPILRKSAVSGSAYFDDVITYISNSTTTDITKPTSASGASGNNATGLAWTNGSDAATGVQQTLIFKRTAGVVGSGGLTLNDQGIYSLTSTQGPSVVGNWVLVDAGIAAAATTYSSGSFITGEEYAIVHRDLAFNYSNPTYVPIIYSGIPILTTQATSGITTIDAIGNATVTSVGDGITTSGICWNTTGTPTTASSKTTTGPTTAIAYTGAITGLTPNTLYYVRPYATGPAGTGYGAQTTFTTLPNTPTTAAATSITAISMVANWTAPVGQGSETFTYSIEVTATSGNYASPVAVINGINSASLSQNISGLSPSTTYYYRVKAVNATGSGAWSAESAGALTLSQNTLTVTISPLAGGSVTADAAAIVSGVGVNFTENQVVPLVASPASGYGFIRWIINTTNRQTDNPYNLTMNVDKNVTAEFGPITCSSYNFDAVNTLDSAAYANDPTNFTANGQTWTVDDARLNVSTSYSRSLNKSILLRNSDGSLITPVVSRPTSINFWARMYTATYTGTIKVFLSTDGGLSYDATPLATLAVPNTAAWAQFNVPITTVSTNTRVKIMNDPATLSSNYNAVVDDVTLCLGPDALPPALTFNPINGATAVLLDANLTISSDEKLFRYIPTTGVFKVISMGDAAFSNADTLATFLNLVKVSDNSPVPFTVNIDATGKLLTINPTSDFGYYTDYKLTINNVADASGNTLSNAQYSQFKTRTPPSPKMVIEEISSGLECENGQLFNFGTIFGAGTITKSFRLYNDGTDPLNITSFSLATASPYTINSFPSTYNLAVGDTVFFTLALTPVAVGQFIDTLKILSNDFVTPSFKGILSGGRVNFVLPYTYQSGCTNPVYSTDELTHDYSNILDKPSQITLNNGVPFGALNFYPKYDVFQNEGSCIPNGSSVLKVGQAASGLELDLANCGEVTVKWCSNGYRKIKITDDSGNIYEESPSFLVSNTCYTTKVTINNPNPLKVNIEFIGNDPALLTSVYYLNITPYTVGLQSGAKNILQFSTGIAGENVRIYDNIILVTVPTGTDLTTITPTVINPSPSASVSPGVGVTQNFLSGDKTYTVTAQNGQTKTYQVSVKHEVDYGTALYADSISITVPMNLADKSIEVVEIKNSTCQVPISGNGSKYTIYFLDPSDMPVDGYQIAGPLQLCIGSIGEYTIINAPATNNPAYAWSITGTDKDKFTIISDTISEVLRIRAPEVMTDGTLDFSVIVEFDPSKCLFLRGEDGVSITITDQPPHPITSVQSLCVQNDMLNVMANGSNDATSYNWEFTPSTTQIVSQNDSSIVLYIGSMNDDITTNVTTQNGCGVTTNSTDYDVPYAKEETTWNGSVSTEWNLHTNWSDRIPKKCTNVIIPDVGSGVEYPIIGPELGECHYITFKPGGAVLNLHRLDYDKAFVELETQRMKWYTLTAPLKNMFSGDYFFNGKPRTYMRLFDDIDPDIALDTIAVGTWTRTFASLSEPLVAGLGYAYLVDTLEFNYPNPPSYIPGNKINYFPRLNADSSLVSLLIPYSSYSGAPRPASAINLPKNPAIAYRFSAERADSTMADINVPIIPGLNLVGNPLMTHLDFNQVYASNSGIISQKVKFWNGSTFTSYMVGDQIKSALDMTSTSIPPMQAFFVEGLGTGTMVLDLETHFIADLTTKLRSSNIIKNTMWIKADNGKFSSSTAIAKRNDAGNQYEAKDAFKLFSQYSDVPEVYTLADEVALDINQFNKCPYTVPLAIKYNKNGPINLQFNNTNSYEDVEVTLLNTKTGEQQNLKALNEYTLNYDTTDTDGFLFIQFRDANATEEVTEIEEGEFCSRCIQVYMEDKQTLKVISPPDDIIQSISIWEQDGRLIKQVEDVNDNEYKTSIDRINTVCIVKVTTNKNTYITKVMIK